MSRLNAVAASLLLAIPTHLFAQQPSFAAASTDTGQASEAIFETKDAAALTAGLAPLAKGKLGKNQREVRVWYSGFGNPQYLVVIRQTPNSTTGQLLFWWDQYYEESAAGADVRVDHFVRTGYDCGPIAKRDSRYGEDRWISSVCEAKLKGTPDWKAFLSEVAGHPLPDNPAAVDSAPEDTTGSETWGITVEMKSGTNYALTHYRIALTFGTPEPGRGPKLQDMIHALAATAKRQTSVAQGR